MRNQRVVRAVVTAGLGLSVGLASSGCGGDDEAVTTELTPDVVASNLEAAGYGDVDVATEPPSRPCDGFVDEVTAYSDPEEKTIQASVQFFESQEAASAAEKCVIQGVTQYCSQAVEDRVYSLDCFKKDLA